MTERVKDSGIVLAAGDALRQLILTARMRRKSQCIANRQVRKVNVYFGGVYGITTMHSMHLLG